MYIQIIYLQFIEHVNVILSLSGPLDTEFREGLDIPDTANTFVQGEIKTLSMDDWMKTSNVNSLYLMSVMGSMPRPSHPPPWWLSGASASMLASLDISIIGIITSPTLAWV